MLFSCELLGNISPEGTASLQGSCPTYMIVSFIFIEGLSDVCMNLKKRHRNTISNRV